VGIDEDKIPISQQQQINIPRTTSLAHIWQIEMRQIKNTRKNTEHTQRPLTKPSTSQTHAQLKKVIVPLSSASTKLHQTICTTPQNFIRYRWI